jgi:ATP-dependent helicase/nuclease subunit A
MNILAKNLLILASAGSGKTFQLGNRVIGLVARGVEPERIVALTFTRKAAGEFADSVLTKLAQSASDAEKSADLRSTLDLADADFSECLERVVRALPHFNLGTMDSFFSKVVRGFQYELGLTGGKFDLIEGPRAAVLTDEMLEAVLGDALDQEKSDEFFHAFRRATLGKEDQGVLRPLREFVERWKNRYREAADLDWGPAFLMRAAPDEWAKQKAGLAAKVRRGLPGIEYNRKGQQASLEKELDALENHVIGSGSLGSKSSALMASILDAVATGKGPLQVKSYKVFTIDGPTGDALRAMVQLAAQCELAAALLRTRAVREVVSVFDDLCAQRLRRRGLLGFNDVKILMGEWARGEDARLRREAVDFRLDARIDHWLLDEFQDTSRADWTGLLPLIDEAASDEEGSMFIVGDKKQAIYAWRGGDVRLFDEVITRYQGGLEIEPMAESWRSCPEVLALVNQVCGDTTTLRELFGNAADRWDWQNHFPANPLNSPEKRGQARVELVGKWDDRLERLAEILRELGVGEKAMTCGVLLRGNNKARQVTDYLRMHGFDVIEEGRREPAKDNPVGIVISHLLKWIADPADEFALAAVKMSPLTRQLEESHGTSWPKIWSELTDSISRSGFSPTIENVIRANCTGWSDFGLRRAGDLLAELSALDTRGVVSPAEAASWLDRFEVSQSPGMAAVQVMTIHKAKGLGFDVVILPEIPNDSIPNAKYFDVAEGPGWLTQTPPKWARAIIPEITEAEDRWATAQQYESFCTLYVALTRAKRGLYVLLEPPSKSRAPDSPSLENWLMRSAGSGADDGAIYQEGSDDWITSVPSLETTEKSIPHPPLAVPVARRSRANPSAAKTHKHSSSGMKFGTEVHALLEKTEWTDEAPPDLPQTDAGKAVAKLLGNPALHEIFEKLGRPVDLFREQTVDAILDGKHLTGIIDRLHLHHDSLGKVNRVEIIDFKTDAVETPADLIERYSTQMDSYRRVMAMIHPNADVQCLLLSVRHGKTVAV